MQRLIKTGATAPRWSACIRSLIVLAFVSMCAASCGAPQAEPTLKVTAQFDPAEPAVGLSNVELALSDATGEPITGATLSVEANMNHAGMVPEFADAVEGEPGSYRAELEFTMAGDWFLLVTIRTAAGIESQQTIHVPGVRPDGSGS